MYKIIFQLTFIIGSLLLSPQLTYGATPTCTGKLSYFYAQNRCEESRGDTFASHEYRCEGITTTYSYSKNNCLSYRDMYKEALVSCKSRCDLQVASASSSPSPFASFSPLPTASSNSNNLLNPGGSSTDPLCRQRCNLTLWNASARSACLSKCN